MVLKIARNLVNYLNGDSQRTTFKFTDGYDDHCIGIEKDRCVYEWTPESPLILEAIHWNESYHNGDPYDRVSETIQLNDKQRINVEKILTKKALERASVDVSIAKRKEEERLIWEQLNYAMSVGLDARQDG